MRTIAICLAFLTLTGGAQAADAPRGKSAFLKSLVIPGWGQYELGQRNTALSFIGAELAMIGGMLSVQAYGRSTRDDYEALAVAHAGVKGDHGHDFYVDVGNWMNVDLYNERRLRDRDYDALYTSSTDRWAWDTEEHRAEMENVRVKSDRAFNSIIYFVGGIVLNHVASAIHAGRSSVRLRAKSQTSTTDAWRLHVQPCTDGPGCSFILSLRF